MANSTPRSTSWHQVGKWYDDAVGEQGHYYHRTLILPQVMKICDFKSGDALLDLACGQGVLARQIPKDVAYTGIDSAASLIKSASQYKQSPLHEFIVSDVTHPLKIKKTDYSHATIILALQNIENPLAVFKNVYKHLKSGGKLLIILNHPCFRIPRQSSWKIDETNKTQYRRIDRYMSDMKIPIQTHPGKGKESTNTLSFHHPLSSYTKWLYEAGMAIEFIDEWCSNKVSEGKTAKMENRSRDEIPLFMAIIAKKPT